MCTDWGQTFLLSLENDSQNVPLIPQDFKRLLYNSKNEIFQSMWPEGAHSITTITKRPQTAGTLFKVRGRKDSQSVRVFD